MEVKFIKSLQDYKYLIMFDLASKNTGVCIWDIEHHKPYKTYMIHTDSKHELLTASLYNELDKLFNDIYTFVDPSQLIIAKEAMPTQLHGGSSTVQTFIALARSHAILDVYTYQHQLAMYDYVGVYPASTHAYFKKVQGWDSKHAVEKNDIKKYVCDQYNIEVQALDESDAVFLAQTLIDVKWNKDIDEQIKEIKRHKKTLVSQKAINNCEEEIARLERLKL